MIDRYEIYVDNRKVGEKERPMRQDEIIEYCKKNSLKIDDFSVRKNTIEYRFVRVQK